MPAIHLGLGSNLGERAANLRAAVNGLDRVARVTRLSSLWETAPLYVVDQPAFLNMALAAETDLAPRELLRELKAMEDELGRVASVRFGPRLIDLDILFHGDVVMDDADLAIPHPRLAERRFALAPLAEISPDLIHPVTGLTVAALLAALPEADDIRCLGPL